MQFCSGSANVPFGPECLQHNQKVEIETCQIQGLHAAQIIECKQAPGARCSVAIEAVALNESG
ncbi:hypothetical protein BLA18110_07135 [Burkholderia lata]|nr:hypothetical protein BLA18110_07135 [Burkholderia lata]